MKIFSGLLVASPPKLLSKITHPLHSLEYIGSISIRIITFSDLEVSTTAKSFNCGSKNKSEHMIYESVSSQWILNHTLHFYYMITHFWPTTQNFSMKNFRITICGFWPLINIYQLNSRFTTLVMRHFIIDPLVVI